MYPGCNSIQAQAAGSLTIKINPVWNDRPLNTGRQCYITGNGDSVYIDAFKFYISAVTLADQHHHTSHEKNSYHLINAGDSSSLSFTMGQLPAGSLSLLSFAIGVDSLMNVSGALDGDLDPAKGMYWAWNTGYINAKTEGRSSACKTLHHAFELHIGGYLQPYNTLRTVSLPLAEVTISSGKNTCLELNADLAQWFSNIDLAKTNSIVMPCKEAMLVADNYRKMFSIKKAPAK